MALFRLLAASALLLPAALGLPTADPEVKAALNEQFEERASKLTYYPMKSEEAGPCDLVTGQDGALWIQDILLPIVARLNTTTGELEEYTIPYTNDPTPIGSNTLPGVSGRAVLACAIRKGSDGMIYGASGIRNQLAQINPRTKKIKVFTPEPYDAAGNLFNFNDLWTGPDGMFSSQTTGNVITQFDYKTHKFRVYKLPTEASGPLGMTYHGNYLWFVQFFGQRVGRLEPISGKIDQWDCPLPGLAGPAVTRVVTEDRYLWFTAALGNGIGRFDMKTHQFKNYHYNTATPVIPSEDAIDGQGRIWFSTLIGNLLGVLTPSTGKIETIHTGGLPGSYGDLDIAVHHGPGRYMWFTQSNLNRVGRYALP